MNQQLKATMPKHNQEKELSSFTASLTQTMKEMSKQETVGLS
jgi:hypothetical protein